MKERSIQAERARLPLRRPDVESRARNLYLRAEAARERGSARLGNSLEFRREDAPSPAAIARFSRGRIKRAGVVVSRRGAGLKLVDAFARANSPLSAFRSRIQPRLSRANAFLMQPFC